ncbi:serine hydrolase domain-containing protein [Cumulibacter manganitolerans]|uniref:serine hydrolase domain-containing protein n=1 Tax=Cumulibacter manganitolerans TaxID=1884992 RepID=UPI0012972D57|nr:serine hydrolase domain-containing protein [Cumulibacter manganitolerans]
MGATDPSTLGFDAKRLTRIDDHLKKYVDDGRLPGWQVQVARHGEVAHFSSYGQRDVEAGTPVEDDTIFRIYSMTKPLTTVAAMMLYEEGAFELTTPVAELIPAFAEPQVYLAGNALKPVTRPAGTKMEIRHLMNHTSGLTYGFHHIHVQDEIYRNNGYEWGTPPGVDLAGACDAWASMPLRFDPGTRWNYSVSTDVLGRVVEVASGKSLDVFMQERIFDPLGMTDTAFQVADDKLDRLAALYSPGPDGKAARLDAFGDAIKKQPEFLSGGGGLSSTTADYSQFCEMLRRGGELGGERLLGSRTLDFMVQNSLPGDQDLEEVGIKLFAETRYDGVGFGLGFSVVMDPVKYGAVCSVGEFAWGGAASTAFWIDPLEDLTVVFMTQLLPSSTYPIRSELKGLVYQALVD